MYVYGFFSGRFYRSLRGSLNSILLKQIDW